MWKILTGTRAVCKWLHHRRKWHPLYQQPLISNSKEGMGPHSCFPIHDGLFRVPILWGLMLWIIRTIEKTSHVEAKECTNIFVQMIRNKLDTYTIIYLIQGSFYCSHTRRKHHIKEPKIFKCLIFLSLEFPFLDLSLGDWYCLMHILSIMPIFLWLLQFHCSLNHGHTNILSETNVEQENSIYLFFKSQVPFLTPDNSKTSKKKQKLSA